jgi:hypothetical protein
MEPSGRSPVARPFAGFRQQPHRSFGADSVKADIRPTNKTARRRSAHAGVLGLAKGNYTRTGFSVSALCLRT